MKKISFNVQNDEIVFKKIPNYENYLVSNTGIVLSSVSGKIMSAHINKSGYKRIELTSTNGVRKKYLVHRLVLSAFPDINGNMLELDSNYNDCSVDHLDKNRTNNSAINLEIVTQAENLNRRYKEHALWGFM